MLVHMCLIHHLYGKQIYINPYNPINFKSKNCDLVFSCGQKQPAPYFLPYYLHYIKESQAKRATIIKTRCLETTVLNIKTSSWWLVVGWLLFFPRDG